MPQIAKGGKWVFGWVIAGENCEILIPPSAYQEYGFQAGETAILLHGNRRSGGIGIGRSEKLEGTILESRFICRTVFESEKRVILPIESGIQAGDRLLAVRGSNFALGLLKFGPIVEEAMNHPELEEFLP
jgi:hypothetical protein